MSQIRVVLCPVDFSPLSREAQALAVEVSEVFGARLILHYNRADVPPGLTRAWEWKEVHRGAETSSAKAEAEFRQMLAQLPRTVSAEARITAGPVAPVLLRLAEQLSADLVVLGSHGWSSADHASVAERIIDHCACPVLTIQEGQQTGALLGLKGSPGEEPLPVLVSTDFSGSAGRAVEYAFDLARALPIRLHLLHVVPRGRGEAVALAAHGRLEQLVPGDLAERVGMHVLEGDPAEHIVELSRALCARFMVMGEHTRDLWRRFVTRDTARELLHRAPCPVWFVPAA